MARYFMQCGSNHFMSNDDVKSAEEQAEKDFHDSKHKWRRLFAECWGTFLLVLVASGAVMIGKSHHDVTLGMQVTAPGLMVMTIIYFTGAVSGAHVNPAVTLAFALRGNFAWKRVPGYIAVQFLGGIAASLFLRQILGPQAEMGATIPSPELTSIKSILIETVLTVGLINTILGTASGARNIGSNGGLAVGAYICLAGLWSAPLTGASMNIVRTMAPDIVRGNLHSSWIYLCASGMAILIAVGFEWILKGKPSAHASKEAQGGGEGKDEKK